MEEQEINAATVNDRNLQLKYKINYLKLKRISELNQNLKEELMRERITSSNASLQIMYYTTDIFSGKDYTVPSLYGYPPPGANPLNNIHQTFHNQNNSRTYANSNPEPNCCTLM